MSCLSMSCSLYITKNVSKANADDSPHSVNSLQPNNINNNNTTSSSSSSLKPPLRVERLGSKKSSSTSKKKAKQPSIVEIERAIGAGRYRDTDPRDSEENDVEFDLPSMSFPGRFEGRVQRRLRETGEWMIDNTENKFRMSGKIILKATFLWILPIWAFLVLIASGAIKLPFSNQFIDQLIM